MRDIIIDITTTLDDGHNIFKAFSLANRLSDKPHFDVRFIPRNTKFVLTPPKDITLNRHKNKGKVRNQPKGKMRT